MSVTILTDSTSDILPEEAARRGIDLVTLKVAFGDQVYRDNLDIDHQQFYEMQAKAATLPTTSQPTPDDFLPYFEKVRDEGGEMVCLLLSGKLSGTLQSATIAKDICGYDRIHIVDSNQAIIGLRALVDLACLLRDEGRSAQEIAAEVEAASGRIRLFAAVDTLEYLHKGGRLSAAAAVAGTLLKVKPILTLKDGELAVLGKALGTKDAMKTLLKLLGDCSDMDPRLPLYLGYTKSDAGCNQFRALLAETIHLDRVEAHSVGAVIGTHVGPGATAVAYIARA